MTPLESILRDLIFAEGPLPLDRYMALCLGHPQHGYYMTRDPFGVAGDFTTAPEVSQIFGELIGVWVAQAWDMLGRPRRFALVELGPGRGTLMADVLRVLSQMKGCAEAAEVHLVETSPVLRAAQQDRVPQATWHDSVASLPGRSTVLLANEFFDALPIRQFERERGHVFERVVGWSDGGLTLGRVPSAVRFPFAGDGVFEDSRVRDAIATHLGDHLVKAGGAALVIDYGHMRSAAGDTLQAMHKHRFCALTEHAGEADLTSHVDFEALGRAFARGGGQVSGVMTQGHFLNAMGIEARRERLSATATPQQKAEISTAVERLALPGQMGDLFKVMAVTGGLAGTPYPF
jgi:NADH dehydrogenase [ubiquinone] 1 alpha subcomplex assembly factor 7